MIVFVAVGEDAFRREHADDVERDAANANLLADDVRIGELVGDASAEHDDAPRGAIVVLVEEASAPQVEASHVEELGCRAEELRRHGALARFHSDGAVDTRRDRRDLRELGDSLIVGHGQRLRSSSELTSRRRATDLRWSHDDEIHAQARDAPLDVAVRSRPDRVGD